MAFDIGTSGPRQQVPLGETGLLSATGLGPVGERAARLDKQGPGNGLLHRLHAASQRSPSAGPRHHS
jgi:hypothetical protein